MNASISISAPLLKPLQSLRQSLLQHERKLSVVGLLLVPLMITLFYFVLIEQQAKLRQARDSALQLAEEQHACNVQSSRQARESCQLGLQRP